MKIITGIFIVLAILCLGAFFLVRPSLLRLSNCSSQLTNQLKSNDLAAKTDGWTKDKFCLEDIKPLLDYKSCIETAQRDTPFPIEFFQKISRGVPASYVISKHNKFCSNYSSSILSNP